MVTSSSPHALGASVPVVGTTGQVKEQGGSEARREEPRASAAGAFLMDSVQFLQVAWNAVGAAGEGAGDAGEAKPRMVGSEARRLDMPARIRRWSCWVTSPSVSDFSAGGWTLGGEAREPWRERWRS